MISKFPSSTEKILYPYHKHFKKLKIHLYVSSNIVKRYYTISSVNRGGFTCTIMMEDFFIFSSIVKTVEKQ